MKLDDIASLIFGKKIEGLDTHLCIHIEKAMKQLNERPVMRISDSIASDVLNKKL